ncbi:hypothetical protein OSTOST_21216, partial [Ostertagia ostertagi]
ISRSESKLETIGSICDVAATNDQNPPSQESSTQLEEILKSVVIPSPIDEEPTVNSLTADYGEPMETSAPLKKRCRGDAAYMRQMSCDVVMTEVQGYGMHGMRSEWRRRFDELENTVQTVNKFFKYIVDCPNKPLVSELIPYVWDAHGSCSVLWV